MEGESSLRFDRAFPIHTAIRSSSSQDRLTIEHEFIDGITWDTPHHYCSGRNYAKGTFIVKFWTLPRKFKILTLYEWGTHITVSLLIVGRDLGRYAHAYIPSHNLFQTYCLFYENSLTIPKRTRKWEAEDEGSLYLIWKLSDITSIARTIYASPTLIWIRNELIGNHHLDLSLPPQQDYVKFTHLSCFYSNLYTAGATDFFVFMQPIALEYFHEFSSLIGYRGK